MFSCIAMGIIQFLCLEYQDDIQVSDFWYLRTPSCKVISEASMNGVSETGFILFYGPTEQSDHNKNNF